MAERTPERLARLLGMVAYLDRTSEGVAVEDLAAHFGVTPRQIVRDVETLWVSGTPGYWPDDLIDFDADSLESGVVRLTRSRGIGHPLRLGTREAVALVVALRALRESLGDALGDDLRDVLDSTLAALTEATGGAVAPVDVRLAVGAAPAVLGEVRRALQERRRLRLRYVNAADVTRDREVDPWQLLTGDEHSYLQAWCHDARGERLFRLDRILAAEVLDAPVTVPAGPPRPTAEYRPGPDDDRVELELSGRARWVAEQLPVEELTELPGGAFRAALRVASPDWLRQLVLRLADDVRDVDPPELAEDVAAAARRALAAYESPADGAGRDG